MVGLFVYFSSSACFPLLEMFLKLQAESCKWVDYHLLLHETCSRSRLGNVLDKWKRFSLLICLIVGFVTWGAELFPLLLCSVQKAPSKRESYQLELHLFSGLGGTFLSVIFCVRFSISGKVVHLSYVWCPPEQTPLLPLLCLLWLFYKETYSRARKDKATQFR